MKTPEIPPPARVPSFGPDTRPRWVVITLALIGAASTPTCATVVQAWRAPDPAPPVVTAIEWDAHQRRVDRIEAKLDQKTAVDAVSDKHLAEELARVRDAVERLGGGPAANRTPRTR